MTLVGKFYAYIVSFTTDAANRTVRNSGEGNGLEASRRLHSEYDPTSSMRRGDSTAGPEPFSLSASRGSRTSTRRMIFKETSVRDVHRQERSALPGVRRQPYGGDVPVDAKEPRGDCYVRQRRRGIRGVVRQTACTQQHETVDPNERKQDKAQRRTIRWTSMRWTKAQEKESRKERTRRT